MKNNITITGLLCLTLAVSIVAMGSSTLVSGVPLPNTPSQNTPSQNIQEGIDIIGGGDNSITVQSIIVNVVSTLMFLIGALSVIMIIFGAFRYVTSAGDAKQVETAKNTILYAVIGVILALVAVAIVNFATDSFSASTKSKASPNSGQVAKN